MENPLNIPPEFYQLHVSVPFSRLNILGRLMDERKDVIKNLTNFKARRVLKKRILPKVREGKMAPSKYAEKYLNKFLSEEEVNFAIDQLNVYVGTYLEKLAESLGNYWYLETFLNEPAQVKMDIKNEFFRWRNENLIKGKDMRDIYSTFRAKHPELSPATLRTWNKRKRFKI